MAFEIKLYLAILLATFLGWLSDPLKGCWWPPTGESKGHFESPGNDVQLKQFDGY